jgi:DNA-nicking Smr family endonuclease
MAQQPNVDIDSSKDLLRSVTTNERGAFIDRNAVPTLDLHGCFLEPAIKKLVKFLETHYALPRATSASSLPHEIVQVITGTGSHSTSAGGPVLKYAVNDFLQRHSFQ